MRLGVLGDDVEEPRPREAKGPQHEIKFSGPEPRRKPVDIVFRARIEAAHRWAAREQVDYLRFELVLALGFEEPLHERPPGGLVAAAEAAWIPQSDHATRVQPPESGSPASVRTTWRRAIAVAATAIAPAMRSLTVSSSRQPRPLTVAGRTGCAGVRAEAPDGRSGPRDAEDPRPVGGRDRFEVAPRPLVDLECLDVATRAIKRDHELRDEALAIRRFLDQPAQLSHEPGMAAKGQIRVDADLERPRAKLVQTLGLCTACQVQRHVREDRAVPEAECLLRNGRGTWMVTGGQRLGCVVYEVLEDLRVENGPTEVDPIAASASLDGNPVRGESPAEPGHV